MTWTEAEQTFPNCSAAWDAEKPDWWVYPMTLLNHRGYLYALALSCDDWFIKPEARWMSFDAGYGRTGWAWYYLPGCSLSGKEFYARFPF